MTPIQAAALPRGARTVAVKMRTVYTVVGVLALTGLVVGDGLYRVLWGRFIGAVTFEFYLLLIAGMVLHEGLHGLAMMACGVARRDIQFGVQLWRGAAFAHTSTPMRAPCFRFVCALPLVVLGVGSLLVGLAFGHGLTTRLGVCMVVAAGGDVAMLLALRNVPSTARIVDHATEPGFHVLPADEAAVSVRLTS
jgi:hypothetical protein